MADLPPQPSDDRPTHPPVESMAGGGFVPVAPGRVVASAAIGVVGTLGVLAVLLVLVNRPEWWRGLLAATAVSAISAAASVPPLAWGLRRGLYPAVIGYFIAAGARAVVSLGGCGLAIVAGHYPATPTLLLMVVYYFVLLAIESSLVAKATWLAKG
jgi:hypothetical protein